MSDTKHSFDVIYIEEAAEALGRTVANMRWMRHKGTGPKSATLGGRVAYRRSDIEAWIDAAFEGQEAK